MQNDDMHFVSKKRERDLIVYKEDDNVFKKREKNF